MSKATKVAFFNRVYSDCYSEDGAVNHLIYLTNKNRIGGHTTENHLRKMYRKRRLGEVLRKYDPIAFNVE